MIAHALSVACKSVLCRPYFQRFNQKLFYFSLNNLGVLNFVNDKVSGEELFLATFAARISKPLVLDVGGNEGVYSNKMRTFSPEATIYAFEPHPKTFKKLQKQAELHNYTALNVGCGSKTGRFPLFDYAGDQSGSGHASLYDGVIQNLHGGSAAPCEVSIIRLGDFIASNNIKKVDLLKIDTEGNELEVVKGAQQAIDEGVIDIIQFEFNEMNVMSRTFLHDFYQLLPQYSFYRLLPTGWLPLEPYHPVLHEIFAFQNIVALRKGVPWNNSR